MKKTLGMLVLLSVGAAVASPSVTGVTLTANDDGTVAVGYTVSEQSIVTIAFFDDGVALGPEKCWSLAGDVNRKVSAGQHTATWNPTVDWPGHATAKLTAAVTAWELTASPPYLVVDLCANSAQRIRYYASTNAMPGGLLGNPYYRTAAMVMRYVAAKDVPWKMGAGAYDAQLDHDYWLGVFQLTKGQLAQLSGTGYRTTDGSSYNGERYWRFRPVCRVTYNTFRGSNNYPSAPNGSSYLGMLNGLTGLSFDLPTEGEWEFAARAGHENGYYGDGSAESKANMQRLGRFSGNCGGWTMSDDGEDETLYATRSVGSYAPNAWGFYDMHGNVNEYCVDWYTTDTAVLSGLAGKVNVSLTDGSKMADGTTAGAKRVAKGGHFACGYDNCRSYYRNGYSGGEVKSEAGFRLILRDVVP